jgi:hypothetical protein
MIPHALLAMTMTHYIAAWIASVTKTFVNNAVSNTTAERHSIEFAAGLGNTSQLRACMIWDWC